MCDVWRALWAEGGALQTYLCSCLLVHTTIVACSYYSHWTLLPKAYCLSSSSNPTKPPPPQRSPNCVPPERSERLPPTEVLAVHRMEAAAGEGFVMAVRVVGGEAPADAEVHVAPTGFPPPPCTRP